MSTTTAPILPEALYSLDQVHDFGLGATAIRHAKRRGLKIRKIGRKAFVYGRDLIAYALGDSDNEPAGQSPATK